MPLGHSAGSTRSEDGSEAFLEGMGNSYSLAFFHSFFSSVPQVPGTVLQDTEDRETFQGSLLGRHTPCVGMEVEQARGIGQAWGVGQSGKTSCRRRSFEWGLELLPGIPNGSRQGRGFQQREQHVARTGFLSLHTVGTWGQIILGHGGCPGHCRLLSTPDL